MSGHCATCGKVTADREVVEGLTTEILCAVCGLLKGYWVVGPRDGGGYVP